MTPQELIKKQIQQEKYNIQTIIDSGMSSGEKLVLLHDLLKWNVVEILNQEIERKKGMKIEVPTLKEYPDKYKQGDTIELNSETVPIAIHNALHQRNDYKVGYNQAIDEDIAHLISLKELIK